MMTVTILTPIYNVEKYISDCAESLFSQTYPHIEYVFCDDCTPDNSVNVLKETMRRYPQRSKAVRIISNERNRGLGMVRKKLLEEVRTECFCIVDSDDLLPKDAIATLVSHMEKTGKEIIDGAHADYADGKIFPPILTFHGTDEAFCRRILCQNIEANRVWGRLYKSTVIQKLPDMFFDGIDYSEDYCATARLSAVTSRAWTDKVVYYYRKDNAVSYTHNVSHKNIFSYLRSNKEILRFYILRGHLPLALEIGLLNTYRECKKAGIPLSVADEITGYMPEHLRAKILYKLFHTQRLYRIGDFCYKAVRYMTAYYGL